MSEEQKQAVTYFRKASEYGPWVECTERDDGAIAALFVPQPIAQQAEQLTTNPEYMAGFRDGRNLTREELAEQAAEGAQVMRECRHCGWMCAPNAAPSKKGYPLWQPAEEARGVDVKTRADLRTAIDSCELAGTVTTVEAEAMRALLAAPAAAEAQHVPAVSFGATIDPLAQAAHSRQQQSAPMFTEEERRKIAAFNQQIYGHMAAHYRQPQGAKLRAQMTEASPLVQAHRQEQGAPAQTDAVQVGYVDSPVGFVVTTKQAAHSRQPEGAAPKDCQHGFADICAAGARDGVVCPADSCDIDDGIRGRQGAALTDEQARKIGVAAGLLVQDKDGRWFVASPTWGGALDIVRAILARASESHAEGLTAAARDVLAERRRQVEAEGWTPEHDDQHIPGTLAQAASCYIEWNGWETEYQRDGAIPINWPWAAAWWKPSDDPRRNLEKAGALILAEIERLDRAALAAQKGDA
jgi:hypothetical protein